MKCDAKNLEGVVCDGPVKPKITFFGESLPKEFQDGIIKIGCEIEEGDGCDLMIVMGTALAVAPFNTIVDESDCPKVLINLENTDKNGYDFDDNERFPERIFLQGKCDEIVYQIISEVGWTKDLMKLMPNLNEIELQKSVS